MCVDKHKGIYKTPRYPTYILYNVTQRINMCYPTYIYIYNIYNPIYMLYIYYILYVLLLNLALFPIQRTAQELEYI